MEQEHLVKVANLVCDKGCVLFGCPSISERIKNVCINFSSYSDMEHLVKHMVVKRNIVLVGTLNEGTSCIRFRTQEFKMSSIEDLNVLIDETLSFLDSVLALNHIRRLDGSNQHILAFG